MTILSTIPIDCLVAILRLVASQDIGVLWLSGHRRLREKLSYGVTKLEVELRPWLPLVWPRFVGSLAHLKEFRVVNRICEHIPSRELLPITGFTWAGLPKTLVSFSVEVALGDSPFLIDCELPMLEELFVHFSTTDLRKAPNFERWTPNLKTLHWKQPNGNRMLLQLSLLPSGLTELALEGISIFNKSWPPSLTKIDLEVDPHTELNLDQVEWFSVLPPTITDLTFRWCYSLPSDWSHLPNLKHVSFPSFPALDDEAILQLPTGLLSLGTLNDFYPLPPHLTSVAIEDIHLTLDIPSIAAMPRSLTRIEGPKLELPEVSLLENFLALIPPNLEYSGYLNAASPLPDDFKSHRQLTSLNLDIEGEMPLHNLPSKLRHLECSGLTPTNISHLPSALTSLTMFLWPQYDTSSFSLMPRGLKILKINQLGLEGLILPDSLSLPRSLTELYLPFSIIKDNDSWFPGLPETLTRLEFEMLYSLPSPKIFLHQMPPNITMLKIPFHPKRISNASYPALLACLPRHLLILNMWCDLMFDSYGRATGFHDTDMALLPRGLLSICLPPSTQLNPKVCLPLLPPNLLFFMQASLDLLSEWRSSRL